MIGVITVEPIPSDVAREMAHREAREGAIAAVRSLAFRVAAD